MTEPQGIWISRDNAAYVMKRLRKIFNENDNIRASLPDGWSPRDKNKINSPMVIVTSDGTPVTNQGFTTEVVRISVYAVDIRTARQVMTRIDAVMMTPMKMGYLTRIEPSVGVMAIKDRSGWGLSSAAYNVTSSRVISG